MPMIRPAAFLFASLLAFVPPAARAHDDDKAADPYAQLGTVRFENSCSTPGQ